MPWPGSTVPVTIDAVLSARIASHVSIASGSAEVLRRALAERRVAVAACAAPAVPKRDDQRAAP